jgi:hypothetical protein
MDSETFRAICARVATLSHRKTETQNAVAVVPHSRSTGGNGEAELKNTPNSALVRCRPAAPPGVRCERESGQRRTSRIDPGLLAAEIRFIDADSHVG